MNAWRSYLAEFVGTGILVMAGVGAAVLGGTGVGHLGVALAFGLTLTFLVYAIGPISGCHVNPAVTVGLMVTSKIAVKDAIAYVVAQLLGAIAGAAVIFGVASGRPGYHSGVDRLAPNGWGTASPDGYSQTSAFGIEIALTFVMVFVVLAATDRIGTAASASVGIGFTLAVVYLVSIPVTGGSANPARSLGSAVFSGGTALGQLWLFIVAPLIGAVIGALFYNLIWGQDKIEIEGVLNVDGRSAEDPLNRTPEAISAPLAPGPAAPDAP
ncbi:aquaporin Z [Antricoccus suffuscus]|uniref:Aquaporin Z n=1 Tax=Antricoccus suffuscus TaxID=1629062 RepID=A0A2T1A2Z6_9ACTN|nr:aquaporin [Antricoccus suffuscus]PRZ42982.1 aquaporin Z [Antricoccus suffuscus]